MQTLHGTPAKVFKAWPPQRRRAIRLFLARLALAGLAVAGLAAGLALSGNSTRASAEPVPPLNASCETQSGDAHAVVRMSQAATLVLDDGREVRLAGVMVPQEPVARAAIAMLTQAAGVEVAVAGGRPDRYGRVAVQVYAKRAGERIWVQRELVEQGHAIVSSRQDGEACLQKLLEIENKARQEKRGVWAHAAYRVHSTADLIQLSRLRSEFVVVEGKVANVTPRAGRLFLNFGDNWRTDFTVAVPKRVLAAAPDTLSKLTSLTGHSIRVRGWIERRYGPAIEVFSVHDIEDLEGSTAAATSP